jgi:hypothetical protein
VDIKKCPACGAPFEWVLWRRERGSEHWEAVAEGTEAEVKRQFAAVPLTEDRYTTTRPCEPAPGLSAVLVSDRGYYEVYDITCDGKVIKRVELLKPPGPGYSLFLRTLRGTLFAPRWDIEIAWMSADEPVPGWVRAS